MYNYTYIDIIFSLYKVYNTIYNKYNKKRLYMHFE